MRKFFRLLVFLLIIFLFFVTSREVLASQTAIGVSPAIVEAVLGDDAITKKVTLFNLTDFPLPIKTLRESFSPQEKLEIPKDKLNLYDASSWINLNSNDEDFILQPREARQIEMTIQSPSDATPGGHYASLIFQPMIPQEIVSKDSVFVFARVAVLLFLEKKGEIVENLNVSNFEVNYFNHELPIEVKLKLDNQGNTHLRPRGQVIVRDLKNKKILSVPISSTIILPGTKKDFNVKIDEKYASKILAGKYSVSAEILYGVDNQVVQSNVRFFVWFPWMKSIVFGAIYLFFILLIIRMRKRIVKAGKVILNLPIRK
jgi:hypothetical protein